MRPELLADHEVAQAARRQDRHPLVRVRAFYCLPQCPVEAKAAPGREALGG